jgi:L-ascorbate metabolism protein UlaG (beta-lactamase superfamily)
VIEPARKVGRKFQNPVETKVGGLSMIPKVLKLYLTNKDERVPRSPLGPFSSDASIYQRPPQSGLRLTWMGHSSFLIEIDGVRLLVDPVWDKRAAPISWLGPKRFFAPPLLLADLPPLDAVLISHDHYDHLGKETIRSLARTKAAERAQWITSLGVARRLRGFGVPAAEIVELDWTQSTTIKSASGASLSITALPARHFSGRGFHDRFETLWSSFVFKGDRHNVYFGADSGVWDGFSAIAQQYGPFDLTMLEVGAYNELWKSIHMGPDGAAEVFVAMGATGLLMPIHWGLFELAPHAWRQPIERMVQLADQHGFKLWAPEPGAPTELIVGQEHRSPWWRPATIS